MSKKKERSLRNDGYEIFHTEYLELLEKYPKDDPTWEIWHRKRILKEWLENEK